ncbi:uncharacterized protein LOC116850612 [Odontomachus brunneus]|uniref:uncharacterized protein LOC116850612 n=1 Tax=Odontomachus brunneus TaxID=486640 RepID=UPI0013F24687|nr:uncharacterized protein LOC116850612 [Odontomachus brunneus]
MLCGGRWGNIDLSELRIGDLRTRRAATGALVLEIPGPEGQARTDALAKRMSALFADKKDVQIVRLSKRADIRVGDLDDSITAEDVISAVAVAGGCGPGEIKAGAIRPGADRMGTIWIQRPLSAARKVAGGGRLKVAWSSVRVEALTKRFLQCFKCLEWGHVRALCKNKADRSGLCYYCGITNATSRKAARHGSTKIMGTGLARPDRTATKVQNGIHVDPHDAGPILEMNRDKVSTPSNS